MIVDQLLRLADNQACGGTTTSAPAVSTYSVNLQQVRNLGQGQVLYAQFYVNSEFLSASSIAYVQFQIRIASTDNLVSNTKIVGASDSFACTTTSGNTGLPTGARIIVPIGGNVDWLRVANAGASQTGGQFYLGASIVTVGQNLAADPKCRVTVDLCLDHQDTYGWNPKPGTANTPVWGSVYPKSFTII